MAGTRNNAKINEDIFLQGQFTRNGVNFEPLSFDKVEIYDDLVKAQGGLPGDIIETILAGAISSNGTGLASYTGSGSSFPLAQAYFDKVFLVPVSDFAQLSFIQTIQVHKDSFGMVSPGGVEKVNIIFSILDEGVTLKPGTKVNVTLGPEYAKYGDFLIERKNLEFCIDESGIAVDDNGDVMSLIETTTMNNDTSHDVFYELSTLNGEFVQQFKVPKGLVDVNFFDLPPYPSDTG